VDPDGRWAAPALDVVVISLDVAEFISNPSLASGAGLVADGIAGLLPLIPAPGIGRLALRTEKAVDRVENAAQAVRRASEGVDAAKGGARAIGKEPNRIYSARELVRRSEASDSFHNFPESFNKSIFSGNRQVISDNYTLYTQRGAINGVEGTFEIGVRPSASGRTEVITHRFFRPDR
jgi:hypothetical protein